MYVHMSTCVPCVCARVCARVLCDFLKCHFYPFVLSPLWWGVSSYVQVFFARIRREHPSAKLAILHVVADPAEVIRRAEQRATETGRVVPRKVRAESAVHLSHRRLSV